STGSPRSRRLVRFAFYYSIRKPAPTTKGAARCLALTPGGPSRPRAAPGGARRSLDLGQLLLLKDDLAVSVGIHHDGVPFLEAPLEHLLGQGVLHQEIGRASCREGGWS